MAGHGVERRRWRTQDSEAHRERSARVLAGGASHRASPACYFKAEQNFILLEPSPGAESLARIPQGRAGLPRRWGSPRERVRSSTLRKEESYPKDSGAGLGLGLAPPPLWAASGASA